MAAMKDFVETPQGYLQRITASGKHVPKNFVQLTIPAAVNEKIKQLVITTITTKKPKHRNDEWFVVNKHGKLDMSWHGRQELLDIIKARAQMYTNKLTPKEQESWSKIQWKYRDWIMLSVQKSKEIQAFKKAFLANSGGTISKLQQEAIDQINEEIKAATAEIHRWNEKRMKLMIKRGNMTA